LIASFVFADGVPICGKAIPALQGLMDEDIVDEALRFYTAAIRMSAVRPASFVYVEAKRLL
jgi:hypothetical protein